MKKVFISFSSKETDEAKRICELLEAGGFPCFIAFRDIQAGHEYASDIIDGLDQAEVMVLILSQASNDSPHVLREVEYAVSHHTPIIVYQVEDVEISKSMKYFLMTHQWIFREMDREERLLAGVSDMLSRVEDAPTEVDGSYLNFAYAKKDKPKSKRRLFTLVGSLAFVILLAMGGFIYGVSHGKQNAKPHYAVGDTVTFGSYQGEPIDWRVLKVYEDGSAYLISKDILCMKAFDAPEGGRYNEYEGVDYWTYENHIIEDSELQILTRGNNDWSVSNLRTWLNSSAELVKYEDQAPTYQAVCLGQNSYSDAPGFLYEFTEDEQKRLVPVKHENAANVWSKEATDGVVRCEDYVYLPSIEELSLFEEAGISPYATVRPKAMEEDQTHDCASLQEHYHTEHYYYWLRDASDSAANMGYIALTEVDGMEEGYMEWSVGVSCYGVRPAITIK